MLQAVIDCKFGRVTVAPAETLKHLKVTRVEFHIRSKCPEPNQSKVRKVIKRLEGHVRDRKIVSEACDDS